MAMESHDVTLLVLACVILFNIINTWYLADHQGLPDDDNKHRQVPAGWRQGQVLPDPGGPERGNNATITAKRQGEYLMH